MENVKKKIVPIFSQKLAGILMYKGYVLISMMPNENGTGKNVFYFNDSESLRKDMEDFKYYRLIKG